MGSQIILPIITCVHVLFCEESPRLAESASHRLIDVTKISHRWHIKKGNYKAAFQSLIKLRNSKVQAARDLFYMHCLITVEREARTKQKRFVELFTVPRNRRAVTASVIVMFLQVSFPFLLSYETGN